MPRRKKIANAKDVRVNNCLSRTKNTYREYLFTGQVNTLTSIKKLVRSHLHYAIQFCLLFNRQDVLELQKIQQKTTKPNNGYLSYEEQLNKLKRLKSRSGFLTQRLKDVELPSPTSGDQLGVWKHSKSG